MKNVLFFTLILFMSFGTYAQELAADDFVVITQENEAYPGFQAKTYRGLFSVGHGQFKMFNYGGTPGNLTALGANETLGSFVFNGYDGSQNVISAVIQAKTITDSRDPRFNFLLSNGVGNQRPNRMTIIGQTGNVGIGITGPTERLDIDGNIRMRTGAMAGYIPVSDADGKMTWTDPSIIFTPSPWTEDGSNVYIASGNVGIGGIANARLHITQNSTAATSGIRMTSSVSANEDWYMYIDGNDDFTFRDDAVDVLTFQNGTQNVGIGTGTPAYKLDIHGTDQNVLNLNAISGTDNYMSFQVGGDSKGYAGVFYGDDDMDFGTGFGNVTGSTHLVVSATPRLTVAANGKVGISTTTPTEEMDVNGSIRMRAGATAGYLPVSDVDGKMTWTDPSTITTASLWTETAINNIYRADGNVGIGVTATGARLHIRQSGTGLGGGIRMTSSINASEDWYMNMNENDDFTFSDDGNTVLTFQDSTGNVGIGVDDLSGNTRLHVRTGLEAEGPTFGIAVETEYEGDVQLVGLYARSEPADGYGAGVYGIGGNLGISGEGNGGTYAGSVFGVDGFAYGSAGNRYGIYGSAFGGTTNYAGYFSGDVNVTGTFTNPSDRKLKQNIAEYTDALEVIQQLETKTYEYKKGEFAGMGLPSQPQIGFIAQEVEKVLPNLVTANVHPEKVEHDEEGNRTIIKEAIDYKAINYIGLIPVLTQGIKELNTQNEELITDNVELKSEVSDLTKKVEEMATLLENMNDKFNQMEEDMSSCCLSEKDAKTGSVNTNVELNGSDVPSLEQNNPNPFYEQTVIKYYIPSAAKNARMTITDIKGSPIKSVNLAGTGLGTVTIHENELPVGTYIYTLFVDGKQVESKQMILIK